MSVRKTLIKGKNRNEILKTKYGSGAYRIQRDRDSGTALSASQRIRIQCHSGDCFQRYQGTAAGQKAITSVEAAGNIVVIKTLSGCGSAAAEAIDSLGIEHLVGSVAGDNTILIVIDDEKNVSEIVDKFKELL